MSSISKSCTKPLVINSVIQLLLNAAMLDWQRVVTEVCLSLYVGILRGLRADWIYLFLRLCLGPECMLFVTVFELFLNSFLLCCSTQCLSEENRRGMLVKNRNLSAIRVINIFSWHFFSRWIQGWDLFYLRYLPVCAPKPGLKRNTG